MYQNLFWSLQQARMAVERQTAMEVEQSEVRQDVVDYLKEQLVYDQESEKSLNLKKYL